MIYLRAPMQFMHLNVRLGKYGRQESPVYIHYHYLSSDSVAIVSKAIATAPLFPLYGQQADKNARKIVRPSIDDTTIVPLRRYITNACAIFPYVGPRSA